MMKSKFAGFEFGNKQLTCTPPAEFRSIMGQVFQLEDEIQYNKLKNILQNMQDPKSALFTFQVEAAAAQKPGLPTLDYKEGGRDFDTRIIQKGQIGGGDHTVYNKPVPKGSGTPGLADQSGAHAQGLKRDAGSLMYSEESQESSSARNGHGRRHVPEHMSSIFMGNEHWSHTSFTISQEEVELNKELLAEDEEEEDLSSEFSTKHNSSKRRSGKKDHRHSKKIVRLEEDQFLMLFPSLGDAQRKKRRELLGITSH